MSADAKYSTVYWDGEAIGGWIFIDGDRVEFRLTRDWIYKWIPVFNGAVSWELEKHKGEIVERFARIIGGTSSNERHKLWPVVESTVIAAEPAGVCK